MATITPQLSDGTSTSVISSSTLLIVKSSVVGQLYSSDTTLLSVKLLSHTPNNIGKLSNALALQQNLFSWGH